MHRFIESAAGDLRFARRYYSRHKLMTATMILVLSIGIGVHSAAFSLIQAMITRPAPGVPRDAALVALRGKERLKARPVWRSRNFSYDEFRAFAGQPDVFAAVIAWNQHDVILDAGETERLWANAQFVSNGFFPSLGIRLAVGPGLPLGVDTADPQFAVVISHELWRSAFAASPDVIGRQVRINEVPLRIAGIAPPHFNGALPTGGTRTMWIPLSARSAVLGTTTNALVSRDSAILQIVGRLRHEVSVERASAIALATDARFAHTSLSSDSSAYAADAVPLRGDTSVSPTDEITVAASVYEAVALLILLITCANVSALAVGNSMSRGQEIAIRIALGASRARVVRQLLTESALLALAGGALGLFLFWSFASLLQAQFPRSDISPDLSTAAFTVVIALGTGLLFGLSPALHAIRSESFTSLKGSATYASGRSRIQGVMVVAQIALTQPLLVGIGVAILISLGRGPSARDAVVSRQTLRLDFDLVGRVVIREGDKQDPLISRALQDKTARVRATMARVAAVPGVVGVVRSSGAGEAVQLTLESSDGDGIASSSLPVEVRVEAAEAGYFALLDIPIVRGRVLVAANTIEQDIPIVVGTDLARTFWGEVDPIGRRLQHAARGKTRPQRYVIVGLYDSRRALARGPEPRVYAAASKSPMVSYLIRTRDRTGPVIAAVQSLIRSELREIPRSRIETLAEIEDAKRTDALRATGAFGSGGLLALLLASIGLYGVVALAVTQRTREIGIRIALGARPRQVVQMLATTGLRLSLTGLVLGLPLSILVSRSVASESGLTNINVFGLGGAIAIVVVIVAGLATWLPARRAATIEPVVALNTE